MSLETEHREILVRVLNLALLRSDLATARRAIALLLRTRPPPPRTRSVTTHTIAPFWTQLLEALDDSSLSSSSSSSRRGKQVLLEWLLISLGSYLRLSAGKLAASPVRQRVRNLADSLYPAFVTSTIERGQIRVLVDRLEEILLEWPFSEDARLRRYFGMALLCVGRTDEGVAELERIGQGEDVAMAANDVPMLDDYYDDDGDHNHYY
ncbi:hypothetical protein BZA70DRAFT_51913 [Myxozyma melibiosi]|uniref:Uncharacterized protein n=1 Tax=Myxozyma melibiosi TaxID=54550 RepID=A0ABR1FFG5_9ASCO